MVNMSLRYMVTGSSIFSPAAKAAVGAVGVSSTSHFSKACLKSRAISGADLLGLLVVGVVVAGRQHVGADHDAPAHFLAEARAAGVLVHLDQVLARRPAARSARRRSAPGWTSTRPAPRCSRPAARTWCAAARPRPAPRPPPSASPCPCPTAPRSRRRAVDAVFLGNADAQALDVGIARGRGEVRHRRAAPRCESFGSWPAMPCSSSALSSTVRANGPGWSSELANATTPQREQRP